MYNDSSGAQAALRQGRGVSLWDHASRLQAAPPWPFVFLMGAMEDTEFKTVLEHITDGVLFIDHDGAVRLYNRSLAQMFSIDHDLHGVHIFSLPRGYPLRQGIFRADRNFEGPYCWERKQCVETTDCPERGSKCCRCWIFSQYGSAREEGVLCCDCVQYRRVKGFLETPKELEIGERTISVLSSFIEHRDRGEIWEVILFRDATIERLDAVVKLAGATAHELRQPLQAIMGTTTLLRCMSGDGEQASLYLDVIDRNCRRMEGIIRSLGHITQYKTKCYIENKKILDIETSSEDSVDF